MGIVAGVSDVLTPSGLIVARRAFDRNNLPNANPPIGSVGPNVPAGFGDTHVMYPGSYPPVEAQAWQGWPVEWEVPSGAPASLGTRIATVFSAIDLNSRIIASLPVYLHKRGVGVVEDRAWVENPAPGLYSSWEDACKQIIWSYQMRGNVYLYALSRYADGAVKHFAVLNPDRVQIELVNGFPEYKLIGWDDPWFDGEAYVATLDPEDVCHIKYASFPGDLYGTSPLSAVAGNYLTAAAAQDYARDATVRGGIPWGVLDAPRPLTLDEVDRLRSQWTDSAARRYGAPAITSGGFTLSSLGFKPSEMALLEMRDFDEARIAVALGVQPFQLGLSQATGGMVYQNVVHIYDYHWRASLRPFTRDIAASMSPWAVPHLTSIRFNPDQYTRPDLQGRVEAYEKLHAMGVLSAADIRDLEDLEGDPDKDPDTIGVAEQEVIVG